MKIDAGTGFNLKTLVPTAAVDPPAADDSTALALESGQAGTSAAQSRLPNMLENNFVGNSLGPSKYIQGMMIGLQVENTFANKLNSLVELYQLEANGAGSYAEKTLAGNKAARAVGEAVEAEVSETEAERMESERAEAKEEEAKRLAGEETGGSGETNAAAPEAIAEELRDETAIDQDASNDNDTTARAGAVPTDSEPEAVPAGSPQEEAPAGSQNSAHSHIDIFV